MQHIEPVKLACFVNFCAGISAQLFYQWGSRVGVTDNQKGAGLRRQLARECRQVRGII